LLDEARSDQTMNHIVKLSYAHPPRRNPILPCLYRQSHRLGPTDFLPETVRFTGQKVTLPKHASEQVLRIGRSISRPEEHGRSWIRRSSCWFTRHNSSISLFLSIVYIMFIAYRKPYLNQYRN